MTPQNPGIASSLGPDITLGLQDALETADKHPAYNSAHEGYGVLLEEVRELEEQVFRKQERRNIGAMRKEALQIAAVALRFARDVCTDERARR